MTVPSAFVRVSLFQATADANTTHVKNTAENACVPQRAEPLLISCLFRSKAEDYRGDVLIPLHSLPPMSSAAEGAQSSSTCDAAKVRAAQLVRGLEQRLSEVCVLHIPVARAKAFAAENHLSASSLVSCHAHRSEEASLPANVDRGHGGTERAEQFSNSKTMYYCGDCSASLAKEADMQAASPSSPSSPNHEKVPWISILQLQRMPGKLEGDTHSVLTAEEWMLRQSASTSDFYAPVDEAAALYVEPLQGDADIEGGECFAAFFRLQMVSLDEKAQRRSVSQLAGKAARPTTSAESPSFFTVQVLRNTVRIGVSPSSSSASPGAEVSPSNSTSSAATDLKTIVLKRLEAQCGVAVRRLLDPRTGAAVLPCESAPALLAASLTSLNAECDAPADDEPHEDPTQQLQTHPFSSKFHALPSLTETQRIGQKANPTVATQAKLFDHLVGLRAQQRADQHYYDGFNGLQQRDWADQRTAISLSELPSESELRLTSVASHASSYSAIYPLSSASRHPSLASRTTTSVYTVSADNSRSKPFAILPGEEEEGETSINSGAMHGDTVEDGGASAEEGYAVDDSASGVVASLITPFSSKAATRSAGAAAAHTVSPLLSHESNESVDNLHGLRDSLRDMNEVFLYEEEETVKVPLDSEEQQQRQRRSSLVWSTPAARGSASSWNLAESGVSVTPLTYRTSTQLSVSPHTRSPSAASAEGSEEATARQRAGGQPNQRLAFSFSSSRSASRALTGKDRENSDAEAAIQENGAEGSSTGGVDATPVDANVEGSEDDKKEGDSEEEEAEALSGARSDAASRSDNSSFRSWRESRDHNAYSCDDRHRQHTNKEENASRNAAAAIPRCQLVQLTASSSSSSSATRHFACTPPAVAASLSASPSSSPLPTSVSVASCHPQQRHAYFTSRDEETTPLPSCSTPPSRSCTSEHELRSHLQCMNPLATQSSQGGEGGGSRGPRGHAQLATAAKPLSVSSRRSAAKRPREEREEDRDASRASPRTPQPGQSSASALSSAVRTSSALSSLPSTVAARRQLTRHRSPICFSPEELSGMVFNPAVLRETPTSSNLLSPSSASLPSSHNGWSPDKDIKRRSTPSARCYGPFTAPYPLHGGACDDEDEDEDHNSVDGVMRWGYAARTSRRPSSPSQRASAPHRSTPQRPLTSVEFGFTDMGVPGPLASYNQPHLVRWQPTADMDSVAAGAPRVTTQRLRRSESHSASGMETWVRFSDAEDGGASAFLAVGGDRRGGKGGGEHGSDDEGEEEEELLLVTQQEIPDYTAQLGSSESDEESDEAREEDEECGSDNSVDSNLNT